MGLTGRIGLIGEMGFTGLMGLTDPIRLTPVGFFLKCHAIQTPPFMIELTCR